MCDAEPDAYSSLVETREAIGALFGTSLEGECLPRHARDPHDSARDHAPLHLLELGTFDEVAGAESDASRSGRLLTRRSRPM